MLLGVSLLVFIGLCGLVWLRVVIRCARAERDVPPIGQFITVDGRQVHYKIDGTGPDLVLIHGSSGNIRDFTIGLVDLLTDRYRVIAFDRPGLGYSDALPRGSNGIHHQARMLRMAAKALGVSNPVVLGQSYGAAVALAWAADAPGSLAGVVSVSGPSHPWNTPLETYYKITSHPLLAPLAVPVIAAIYTEAQVNTALGDVFAPQDVPANYDVNFGVALTMTPSRIRANANQRAVLKSEIIALEPKLAQISVPIEIVHGDVDTVVSYKIHGARLIEQNENARMTVLKGIGHMPHHVARGDVVDAIDRAVARAGLL